MPGSPTPARRGHGHPWLTLIAVSLGLMMVTLDGTVVSIANPTIGKDLKVPMRYQLSVGMGLVAGGLLGLTGISPTSGFASLWPWFLLMALGMGLVFTGASQAIVGSAPMHRAGLASGLQQTLLQVGGVLGTSVLGAILTSRIGSLLPSRLADRGITGPTAAAVVDGNTAIAQGVVPVPPGTSAEVAAKITDASYAALTTGMHTTFVIAAIVVVSGGLVALVWVRMKPGHGMLDFSAI